jgi:hypothetical protein
MDYTIRTLRKCKEYGFKVYMDSHHWDFTPTVNDHVMLELAPDQSSNCETFTNHDRRFKSL